MGIISQPYFKTAGSHMHTHTELANIARRYKCCATQVQTCGFEHNYIAVTNIVPIVNLN